MAEHNEFGNSGEKKAVEYLREKGYVILHQNWRSGHKEIDIVAQQDACLVVVEVKTRKSSAYGRPSEAVTASKIRRIVMAAEAYVQFYRIDLPIRYDIISVIDSGEQTHIEHIKDAFRSPVWY